MSDTIEILVSVHIVTYNHEKFISQAIEGAINQECNFKYEILVGDDCSKDGTTDQILEYKKKYPDLIIPVINKSNLGPFNNHMNLFKSSKGKYIALCEGDDYWTDKTKLQKQVDYMENHPECSVTYHSCKIVNQSGNTIKKSKFKNYKDYSADELISGKGELITNAVMFRNVLEYPEHLKSLPNGDNVMWHLLGFYGSAKFISNIGDSAYRVHHLGVWTSEDEVSKLEKSLLTYNRIKHNIVLIFDSDSLYLKIINGLIVKVFVIFLYRHLRQLKLLSYIKGLRILFKNKDVKFSEVIKAHIKHLIKRV